MTAGGPVSTPATPRLAVVTAAAPDLPHCEGCGKPDEAMRRALLASGARWQPLPADICRSPAYCAECRGLLNAAVEQLRTARAAAADTPGEGAAG